MNSKLVSVIIPCYNMEKYLKDCFFCLDNLTYENLEIIFVDDGAKDKTPEMIDAYCATHTNAKCVHKPNGGLSSARNAGIDVATGEYLYFYDPDDIINCEIITHLVEILENANCEFSITYNKKIYEDKFDVKKLVAAKKFKEKTKIVSPLEAFSLMINKYEIFSSVWNKIYLAKIIKDNNLRFNENCKFGEDTIFNIKYLKHCKNVVISNKPLYFYLQRKTSLIHQNFKETRLTVFDDYNKYLENNNDSFVSTLHVMRLYNTIECLYFIKKSNYSNSENIKKLINYLETDLCYLKKCKNVKLYRKMFIPLVPGISKILLKNRLKSAS
ncbi:MAG: glycosyltransferase [Clostridia bacterium]|nr:glycosyltransferase [Clostridia bacterium]